MVALLQQCALRNRTRRETPIRVRCQLLVALVGCVDILKECCRVGRMKHHRQTLFATELKDGSKALVVNAQQLPVHVLECQPKVFPKFDSTKTAIEHTLQPLNRLQHEIWPLQPSPVHPANGEKALCRSATIAVSNFERSISYLHRDVDNPLHAC